VNRTSDRAENRPPFLELLPTRVRRNYTGGALLEAWRGGAAGRDGDEPEDWIASTTEARNPGQSFRAREGITRVRLPGGRESDLRAEIGRDPEYFLGPAAAGAGGREIGFLAKLLDAATRLHVQVHPTAAFAQRHLGMPHGKLETYVILGARPHCEPCLWLGFNEAPSRAEWRRIIAEQDLPAMHARLNRVAIAPGEVWLVPGGRPHAIGEGVLMLEVMEPSDLVVRCEFARDGVVVPPEARYMGRDLDFCLEVFEYESHSPEDVRARFRLGPRIVAEAEGWLDEELVGRAHTDCFVVRRLRATTGGRIPEAGRFRVLLIMAGAGRLAGGGGWLPLRQGTCVALPAGAAECRLEPARGGALEAVLCISGG
jgi:mannose-6-phosphate isomerase